VHALTKSNEQYIDKYKQYTWPIGLLKKKWLAEKLVWQNGSLAHNEVQWHKTEFQYCYLHFLLESNCLPMIRQN